MWHLSSRVSRLNHFPNEQAVCYVKRDDELGCGISGTKLRKYASLIPHLLAQDVRHLIIIAGPQSNNLLAAVQIAREFELQITAFLIKPRNTKIQGNFKLTRLFLEENDIVWVDRAEWPQVEELANTFKSSLQVPGFILNEGASVAAAMPGSMSLASDIILNEQQLGLTFHHIFIDAGTGFSAAGLIKGLDQLTHKALVHVLLLADDQETFDAKIMQWTGSKLDNYTCFYPNTAKSFGAVNHQVKEEIKRVAREEGILIEPIYSAKLFYAARRRIESEKLKGNVLLIHSGGLLTMAGFEF